MAPVSTGLFDVLRVTPALGRGFRPDEERPGAGDVAVVSFSSGSATSRDGPTCFQRSVAIDNRPFAIVGVAPAGLRLEFTSDPHIFVPVTDFSADGAAINAIARRGPGAGDRVEAELGPIFDATLDQAARARGRHVRVRDLDESTRAATWRTYVVFMVAAAVLLFAACANVANLLLGRGVARRPEFVLQAALGSSRSRLLRQLLVESLIVAGAAAAAGLALGAFGIRAFVALAPASCVTPGRPIAIDIEVAFFAIALAALTAAVCGALPARQAPHRDLRDALASAGRRLGSEPGQQRLRSGLLAIQVTLAFLLLERRHSHEQLLPAESGAARVHAGQRLDVPRALHGRSLPRRPGTAQRARRAGAPCRGRPRRDDRCVGQRNTARGRRLAGVRTRLANRHRPPPSRLMDRSMSSRPNILVSLASAASPGAISRRLTSPRARASPSSISTWHAATSTGAIPSGSG